MVALILHTNSLEEAVQEIEERKEQVSLICTNQIMICNVSDDFDSSSLKFASSSIPDKLDDLSQLYVEAYNKGFESETSNLKWGEGNHSAPKNRFSDVSLQKEFEIYGSDTSTLMVGKIAVGVVIVSGPTTDLKFSNDDLTTTLNGVLSGLKILSELEDLAGITFIPQTSILSINVQQTSCSANAASNCCEADWRDPALSILGVSSGLDGVNQYNERLRSSSGTRWAITAFFIKYNAGHFAYAGSGRVCMQYANNDYGPSKIGQVFAHEVAHLFGAADEYIQGSTVCTCAASGYYNIPNLNCDGCHLSWTKQNCLMESYAKLDLCIWSRWQIGWIFRYYTGQQTGTGPASATFNKSLYCAFKSNGDDNRILVISSSQDGKAWSQIYETGQYTSAPPSLAEFKDKLFCAFKSNDDTNRILIMSSSDGKKWGSSLQVLSGAESKQPDSANLESNSLSFSPADRELSQSIEIMQSTQDGPSLAVYNDLLYCAFRSNDSTNRLLLVHSPDGASWSDSVGTNNSTQGRPSLASLKHKLFCAFKSNDDSSRLIVIGSPDGNSWTTHYTSQTTSLGPSLSAYEDTLFCCFRSNDSTDRILITSPKDGENWNPYFGSGETTGGEPQLTTFNDRLCLFFKSNDDSNNLILNVLS